MRGRSGTITRRLFGGIALAATLAPGQTAPNAAAILDEAKVQAARGQRSIFAIFHASW